METVIGMALLIALSLSYGIWLGYTAKQGLAEEQYQAIYDKGYWEGIIDYIDNAEEDYQRGVDFTNDN